MKQQSPQHQEQQEVNPLANEKIGPDLLLRSWNKSLEIVNEAIDHNKRSGVQFPSQFIQFLDTKPMNIMKKENWLKQTISPKGQPYTLNSLLTAGTINESEVHLYGELQLPRREMVNMIRIQLANKTEWLQRTESWYGLSRSGSVVSLSVDDLDYYRTINVERKYVDKDPNNPGGEQALVKSIGSFNQYMVNPRIYLTPFTKSTVEQALKNAGPPVTEENLYGKISLMLIREDVSNPRGLRTEDNNLDAFINRSFDSLFDQAGQPASTNVTNINIDPEQFKAFLKYQQQHNKDHQYQ